MKRTWTTFSPSWIILPHCASFDKCFFLPLLKIRLYFDFVVALLHLGRRIHNVRRKCRMADGCPCGENRAENDDLPSLSATSASSDVKQETVTNEVGPETRMDLGTTAHVKQNKNDDSTSVSVTSASCLPAASTVQSCSTSGVRQETASNEVGPETHVDPGSTAEVKQEKNDDSISVPVTSASCLPAASNIQPGSPGVKQQTEGTEASSKAMVDLEASRANSVSLSKTKFSHLRPRILRRSLSGGVLPSSVSLPAGVTGCGQPPHNWLDGGRLLQLLNPDDSGNIGLFREHWSRGVPIIVSNCDDNLDKRLWNPEAFLKKFGSHENDLVDCSRNVVLVGHQMRRFWEGFECVEKRLRDRHGRPMILKLKDWPPTEDFAEMLPNWFSNLLQALPLQEYTDRTGELNLVSRLPGFFVRPDLGPKMYNAYGSALAPRTGSTNLHLDISDAVNLMVYVGIPRDEAEKHEEGE